MRIEYLSIMPEKLGTLSRVSTFPRSVVPHAPCAPPADLVFDAARARCSTAPGGGFAVVRGAQP